MAMFTFTNDELGYIKMATAKLMKIRQGIPPADWKKPQNQLVKKLAAKFKPEVTEEQAFVLDRNCIRALLDLSKIAHKSLVEATIPAYERKLADAAQADYARPYHEKAVHMKGVFEGLTKKLEEGL